MENSKSLANTGNFGLPSLKMVGDNPRKTAGKFQGRHFFPKNGSKLHRLQKYGGLWKNQFGTSLVENRRIFPKPTLFYLSSTFFNKLFHNSPKFPFHIENLNQNKDFSWWIVEKCRTVHPLFNEFSTPVEKVVEKLKFWWKT